MGEPNASGPQDQLRREGYRSGVPLLVPVLTSLALAASAAGATTQSGLRGIVMRDSASPVCRDDDCVVPAADVVLVFSRGGKIVARTTTGPRGGYRIRLRPGRYAVTTAKRTVGVGLTPRTAVVPRGRVARVDFHLDSGRQ